MRHVEDPSIAAAARVEHAVMMQEILARYEAGEAYFVAREAVMAEHGPRIAREMGKETAKRALAAVCSHEVSNLPRSSRLKHAEVDYERWLKQVDRWHGPGHYFSSRQRFFIRHLGATHWAAHPVGVLVWIGAVAVLIGAAWLFGFTSAVGLILCAIAGLITFDALAVSSQPYGTNLQGDDLKAWLAAQAEAEDRQADADYEAKLEREAEEANRIAEMKSAQRAIRDFARNAEKDADAKARAVLPEPPPLDDFAKAFLKPRGGK